MYISKCTQHKINTDIQHANNSFKHTNKNYKLIDEKQFNKKSKKIEIKLDMLTNISYIMKINKAKKDFNKQLLKKLYT